MKNLIIGAALAALVLFIWGYLFWAVGLVDPYTRLGDEEQVLASLAEHLPQPGVYQLPDWRVQDEATFMERHRRGPLATIFLRKAGAEPGAPIVFVLGFLHMFATCFLLALLLERVLPAATTYSARATVIALAGAAMAVWADFNGPIWWLWPWAYGIKVLIYDLVAWTLAGLVLAAFVRERSKLAMAEG